jgi:hypothetical protein
MGTIDNGLQAGGPCTPVYDTNLYPGDRSNAPCAPGVLVCDAAMGTVCVGGVTPSPEVCDGIDNDCDGTVDEAGPPPDGLDGTVNQSPPPDAAIGDVCGVDTGACQQGNYVCLNGVFACLGGQGPVVEQCDCNDNDCDGTVDNQSRTAPRSAALGLRERRQPGAIAPAVQRRFPCARQRRQRPRARPATAGFCVVDHDAICRRLTTKAAQDVNGWCSARGQGANCIEPPVCICKNQTAATRLLQRRLRLRSASFPRWGTPVDD